MRPRWASGAWNPVRGHWKLVLLGGQLGREATSLMPPAGSMWAALVLGSPGGQKAASILSSRLLGAHHTPTLNQQWERLPGPPKGRKTRNCGSSEGLTAGVPGSCGVTGSLATSWAGSSSPHLPLLFCGHGPSSLPAQSGEGSFPEADDQRGAHNWMSPHVSASSPRTGGRRCLPKVRVSPAPLRVVGPAVAPGLGQACPFLLRQVVCMCA